MPLDAQLLEQHRTALTGHCYRMLGSVVDADDAVQETMVRAWRGLEHFDQRASLRTWLYRIATNVCVDALSDRSRRARPIEEGPDGSVNDTLETRPRTHWLEPVLDSRVLPTDTDPAELLVLRQSIRLAFIAALQHLPAKQRAILLLTEVLGWSAAEVGETLNLSVPAINSALQRARTTLATRNLNDTQVSLSEAQDGVVDRYVRAFERYDVDALTALVTADATLSMPPYTLWLRGRETIRSWLSRPPGSDCRGSRLVPTTACGSPAFAQYRNAGEQPWALIVLELSGERISSITSFLDVDTLFPRFGLPQRFPTQGGPYGKSAGPP